MTYENAIEWLERNVNMYDYDNFRDWYEACEEKIETRNLFEKPEFNRMLEDTWLNEFGSFDREEIDVTPSDIPSGQKELYIPREQAPVTVFSKSPIFVRRLPEEQMVLPPTGRMPELPMPAVIIPNALPIQQKIGILSRIKNAFSIFRRKK